MPDDKKIIVDEDWKTRVAAEKEAFEREHADEPHVGEPQADPADRPAADAKPSPENVPKFSPASFEMLVTMFATEAMVALGQFPHPVTQKYEVDPEHAHYAIDMLEVIADKTKGNLAPGEDAGLQQLLHQLRMAFVALQTGEPL